MKKIFTVLAAMSSVVMLLGAGPAKAGNKQIEKAADAVAVLNEIMAIPEQEIPPVLLRSAYGIAIIPGLLKAGFLLGARYGAGVLLVHRGDSSWSNPVFVTLTGGSFGLQIGAQSTDVILVFKTSRSVDAITQGKFTLGADASVSAGPVGRHAEADTDIMFGSEIYSYARSRGLFAGVALEGAAIQIDYYANSVFYNTAGLLPTQILTGNSIQSPYPAEDLRRALARYANR